VPHGRPWIALIKRPINDPVEKHGSGSRKYHADDHEQKNSRRRQPVRRHDERCKSKGKRKNRMRKTNEPKKSANGSGTKLAHHVWAKLLILRITDCAPEIGRIFPHEF
jgi:hypothetical protein